MDKIKVGDLVKCVRPISTLSSQFDLSDGETYEVTYIDYYTIRLLGHDFEYWKSRFVLADDIDGIEDVGVDFF